jgi:hypothetical protein
MIFLTEIEKSILKHMETQKTLTSQSNSE